MKKYRYRGTTADIEIKLEPEFFSECLYIGLDGEDDNGRPIHVGQWLPYEEILSITEYLENCQKAMKKFYTTKKGKK